MNHLKEIGGNDGEPAVRLSELADTIVIYTDPCECYLDRNTMEIIVIFPDELGGENAEALQALETGDPIRLPTKRDLHEWKIMRDFSESQTEGVRRQLMDAIHRSGAFRNFRRITDRLDITESWYTYRDEAIKAFVRSWLTIKGIPFTED